MNGNRSVFLLAVVVTLALVAFSLAAKRTAPPQIIGFIPPMAEVPTQKEVAPKEQEETPPCIGNCLLQDLKESVGYIYSQPTQGPHLLILIFELKDGVPGKQIRITDAWLKKFDEALKRDGKNALPIPHVNPEPLDRSIQTI